MPTTPATAAQISPEIMSNGVQPSEAPEPIMLELVDEDGTTIGTAEKLAAHQAPGLLHRAFSVF
ncbi:isopentenyl-diphosphate delta-isomerase, partial [Streptomyces sp. NPDC039028]